MQTAQKSHEHDFMNWAASVAPTFTVIFTALSFVSSGVISYYYLGLYVFFKLGAMGTALAIGISVIMQGGRFVFLVLGQRDLANGAIGKAVFGFLFSLALTVFTHVECQHAARAFSGDDATLLMWIQYSIIGITWIGQILEVRLLISTAGVGSSRDGNAGAQEKYIPSPNSTAATEAETNRIIYQMALKEADLRRQLEEATKAGQKNYEELTQDFKTPERLNNVPFTLPQSVRPTVNGFQAPPKP